MIRCENISKEYMCGDSFFAVKDVSLEIKKGEFVSITGKSGSGKSSLMNMIGLIDRPTSGNIFIDGLNVSDLRENELAKIRNQKIGYIFQSFYLDHAYTVMKNVEMPLLISNVSRKERQKRAAECLDMVGLSSKSDICAGKLSGGEKQRVSIARAIANDPEIILADEPCGNLDSENTENIMNILNDLHKKGKTILLITHSMEEADMAQHKIILKDGKIINEYNKLF